MRQFCDTLQSWNFRICGIFILDSHFMVDGPTFLSGTMAALSVMVNLEVPHVNVISKIDLLSAPAKRELDRFLEPDTRDLTSASASARTFDIKYQALTEALAKVLDDYSLVKYFPLDITDEENIADLFLMIDNSIQYGEDLDVKVRDFDEGEQENDDAGDVNE
jgi:hypothetical protein